MIIVNGDKNNKVIRFCFYITRFFPIRRILSVRFFDGYKKIWINRISK